MASGDINPEEIAFNYFYSGDNNINSTVQEMASNLFEPHARELRRFFEAVVEDNDPEELFLPASDRTVSLDHNSEAFEKTLAALADIARAVKDSNQIDPEDKARVVAEISASEGLLRAPKTRVAAVMSVGGAALLWLSNSFANGIVGTLAGSAFEALKLLFGL